MRNRHCMNILRNLPVLLRSSPRVPAAHIPSKDQTLLLLRKRCLRIDRIIITAPAQKLSIIQYRKQRRRKENRASPLIHTVLQILRRIHTEQFHPKPSVLVMLCINHIILVDQITNIQKTAHLKIKIQKFLSKISILQLFQVIFHLPHHRKQCQ